MKNVIHKVKAWAARPDVQEYANQAHETIRAVGEFVPIKTVPAMSAVASAVSIANRIINPPESNLGPVEALSQTLTRRGFIKVKPHHLSELLVESGVLDEAFVVKNIGQITAFEIAAAGGQLAFIADKIHERNYGLYTKGVSQTALLELLWSTIGHMIKLEQRESQLRSNSQIAISGAPLPDTSVYVPGFIQPAQFVHDVRTLHRSNASPAYILNGPPGCGKTSFCFQVAALMGHRCLTVASDILKRPDLFGEVTELILVTQPTVIILDDVDGCRSDKELLATISSIRRSMPRTLILSTCNEWDLLSPALRRPGRLGMRIDFTAPDLEGRRKILAHYSSVYGVNRDLSWIADLTAHPLLTQDYLVDIVQQAVLQDDEGVRRHIAATLEHLKATAWEDRA